MRTARNVTIRRGHVCHVSPNVIFQRIYVYSVRKRTTATEKRRYRTARAYPVYPMPWRKRRIRGVAVCLWAVRAYRAKRDIPQPLMQTAVAAYRKIKCPCRTGAFYQKPLPIAATSASQRISINSVCSGDNGRENK